MNREQRDKNVANSTRQEMADQMKRVRQNFHKQFQRLKNQE